MTTFIAQKLINKSLAALIVAPLILGSSAVFASQETDSVPLIEAQQHQKGERPQGEHAKGERPEGKRPRGERTEGDHSKGERPEGEHAKGEHPEGKRDCTDDKCPEGKGPKGERKANNS